MALITALAAVVPQVLTWRQNQKRDEWEKARHEDEVARDVQLAKERAAAARLADVRQVIVAFVQAASTFISQVGRAQDMNNLHAETLAAIGALAPVRTTANEAIVVLHASDEHGLADPIFRMLVEFDDLPLATAGTLRDYADSCSKALSLVRNHLPQ